MKHFIRLMILVLFFLASLAGLSAAQQDDALVKLRLLHSHDFYPVGGQYPLALMATVADGFHINSDQPDDSDLIPTRLSMEAPPGITLERITYPQPRRHQVKGENSPWLVWDGQIKFLLVMGIAPEVAPGSHELTLSLFYQACDDNLCQMPALQEIKFKIEATPSAQRPTPINRDVFK